MQGNSYIDVESLCHETLERNFRGDPNSIGNVISLDTYVECWRQFTNWCESQIEVGRAVNMAGFGCIGY